MWQPRGHTSSDRFHACAELHRERKPWQTQRPEKWGKAPGPCRERDNRWAWGILPVETFSCVGDGGIEIPKEMALFPGDLPLGMKLCFATTCGRGHVPHTHTHTHEHTVKCAAWCISHNHASMLAATWRHPRLNSHFITIHYHLNRFLPHLVLKPSFYPRTYIHRAKSWFFLFMHDISNEPWLKGAGCLRVPFEVGTKRIPALLTTDALSFSLSLSPSLSRSFFFVLSPFLSLPK